MSARVSSLLMVLTGISASLFFLGSCDTSSFEPFSENEDKPFSMYGYLDTSADTQWVRVIPVRQTYLLGPEEIDALVTLEQPESGDSAVMEGLLHRYDEAYAWNFRTTMKIKPNTRYRITAERSDGAASHATVLIPGDFPQPIVRVDPFGPDIIEISGIDETVLVDGVYNLRHTVTGRESEHRDPVRRYFTIPSNRYAWLNVSRKLSADFGENVEILDFHIFVAALSEDWPEAAELDEAITAIPGEASNVENGLGYVGGVAGRRVPFKSCWNENGQFIACPKERDK